MSRLNLLVSWFFTCLGIALLVLIPFMAPEKAFADPGVCEQSCCEKCFNSPPGSNCDETSSCYLDCYDVCQANAAGCKATTCLSCVDNCLINYFKTLCTYTICTNSADCNACKCSIYLWDGQKECCCF
jgi:hypothetical protein